MTTHFLYPFMKHSTIVVCATAILHVKYIVVAKRIGFHTYRLSMARAEAMAAMSRPNR